MTGSSSFEARILVWVIEESTEKAWRQKIQAIKRRAETDMRVRGRIGLDKFWF